MSKAAQSKMLANDPPPALASCLMFYIEAFYALCTERNYQTGMMLGIPVSKIIDYGVYLGVEDIEGFVSILQKVDYEYLTYANERMEQQRKLSEQNAKRKNR